jgi:hypothetical protein
MMFWTNVMNIYRVFLSLPVMLMLMFTPVQSGPGLAWNLLAQTTGCTTSSPASAAYSVKLCITSPQNGSNVTGAAPVTVTVSFTGTSPGVQRMVYYLNASYLLTDYKSPYSFTLPSLHWVDGGYKLSVEALMRDGFTTQRASLPLNFANGVKTPPVNGNQFHPTSGTKPAAGAPFVVAATGDGASGEVNAANVTKLLGAINPNLLLYLGDVYEKGSYAEFYNWYGMQGTNFSQFRSITNPTIGNHEYVKGSAQGYFDYWDNIPSYYSFDAGGWHFISLNSNGRYEGIDPKSSQYLWLSADLAAHAQACTIVYYHHPLFNIGPEGPSTGMASIWALLAQNEVPIVINGHDHDYQRWVALDGKGLPDPNGVTEFVAGGGGHGLQTIAQKDNRVAYSNSKNPDAFGVLKLELSTGGAKFSYLNTNGSVLDSGVIPCKRSAQVVPAPVGISAALTDGNQVALSWSAVDDNMDISGYTLYRNAAPLATISDNNFSYTDTTVRPTTTYTYSVDAFDQGGNHSSLSSPVSITTAHIFSNRH